MANEHLDVLVVGAGLSGIAAGYYLQTRCPRRSYAIVEARERLGGTWDLFRYPGVRSDSDMYTLGFSFRPWTQAKAIADGPSILSYLRETAEQYGIDRKIRFGQRVTRAAWSSRDATWTVDMETAQGSSRVTCNFLFLCTGYYDYAQGYMPEFAGIEQFAGAIVHPQEWNPQIDYAGRRVLVIGSGATAVTLVPELAKSAAHVTMLQRSPTYVIARPDRDLIANALRRCLPWKLAHRLIRWKNVLLGMLFYAYSRRRPESMKELILKGVREALGPEYDVDRHFTPRYKPWDQRLCLVPNGDLFEAIKAGRASVVTDQIERFTERGIRLASGAELEADLIITATGLNLQVAGDIALSVDGARVDVARCLTYKGMMYSDVPNLAAAVGYTNASWTLKCELTCAYVCRLLQHMEQTGARQCTARNRDSSIEPEPWVNFSSSYVLRSLDKFPKQGSRPPWRLYQNYARDLLTLRYGELEDGILEFSRSDAPELAPAPG